MLLDKLVESTSMHSGSDASAQLSGKELLHAPGLVILQFFPSTATAVQQHVMQQHELALLQHSRLPKLHTPKTWGAQIPSCHAVEQSG